MTAGFALYFRHTKKLVQQFFLLIFPSFLLSLSWDFNTIGLYKKKSQPNKTKQKSNKLSSAPIKRVFANSCQRRLTIVPITVAPLQNLLPDVSVKETKARNRDGADGLRLKS